MYQGPGADVLAMTGLSAVGLAAYIVGGWVLIIAGIALIALVPRLRKKSKKWKK